jgi:hypothetical protein
VYGPKRDEVTGEWRKLHNMELHILYSSPNIIREMTSRRMRLAGHVTGMGEEGKRPLGKRRRRRENGITMDLRETGFRGCGMGQLAQDRDRWLPLINTAMKLRVVASRN